MKEWELLKHHLQFFVVASPWFPDKTKQNVIDDLRKIYIDNHIYEIQMRASSFCRLIEVSRLISNEVGVPLMVHEYCELAMCLKALNQLLPLLKAPADISLVKDGIDVKLVGGWLKDDLQLLANNKNVIIDLTKCMTVFKNNTSADLKDLLKSSKLFVTGFVSEKEVLKQLKE